MTQLQFISNGNRLNHYKIELFPFSSFTFRWICPINFKAGLVIGDAMGRIHLFRSLPLLFRSLIMSLSDRHLLSLKAVSLRVSLLSPLLG